MKYNTQQKRMSLPEYGRSVQNMVDYCCAITDKEERQNCGNAIIAIMGNMFPQLRDTPEFNHKLWDHLAIMSDFKLDIDYPYEIIRFDSFYVKPDKLSYPQANIRYRHYGRLIADLVIKACELPQGEERDNLIALIGNHMRKDYFLWNKDLADDQKISKDMGEYSNNELKLSPEVVGLMKLRRDTYEKPVTEKKNTNSKNGQKPRRNNYKK